MTMTLSVMTPSFKAAPPVTAVPPAIMAQLLNVIERRLSVYIPKPQPVPCYNWLKANPYVHEIRQKMVETLSSSMQDPKREPPIAEIRQSLYH